MDTEFVDEGEEPTEAEFNTAMEQLLHENDMDEVGRLISGVLEFLTLRALHEGPYYIMTDDRKAITVFAANEHAEELLSILPDTIRPWDDLDDGEYSEDTADTPEVITDRDTGDEQGNEAE